MKLANTSSAFKKIEIFPFYPHAFTDDEVKLRTILYRRMDEQFHVLLFRIVPQ
jgi:hypothetical protein